MAETAKDTQVVTVRLPRDVYEGLRALSFATDTSINELVLRAVGNYMTQGGHRELVDDAATRGLGSSTASPSTGSPTSRGTPRVSGAVIPSIWSSRALRLLDARGSDGPAECDPATDKSR
jgi:hypothetical protein